MHQTKFAKSKTRKDVNQVAIDHEQAGSLSAFGLAFIGIGGIIGAGFFLGSGLPIRTAGPSVLLAFLIGAIITAQVIGSLATLAINEPVKGSFMVYAREYIGSYAGFLVGWSYYAASILTIASEAVAMSIFTKMWLPLIPTWIMASFYAAIILAINAFGVKNFDRAESFMSAIKIAALAGFILFVGYTVLFSGPHLTGVSTWNQTKGFFSTGISGMFQSMLIVIFAYAGVGVFGSATSKVRHPKDIDKAAWYTVLTLAILYILSIGLLLYVIPWYQMSTTVSPFVVALERSNALFLAETLNGIVLVASFSVMAGSVFAANQILWGLGSNHEAPHFVTRSRKNDTPYGALGVTTIGIGLTILISYLLPANVYNFLISASSFLTFLNWFFILWAFLAWRLRVKDHSRTISSLTFGQPFSTVLTMLFIIFLTGYALMQRDQRVGFYAFAALVFLISATYYFFTKHRAKTKATTSL